VDDESWAIPCIIQLRNTCNIEKDSKFEFKPGTKIELENSR
jgi:hypothetical protein